MERTPTHFLTLNADGTSHLRPLAKNVPKGGCTCGTCGTKPPPKRGRCRETDALIAQRKRFLFEAQHETGAARRAVLGLAREIADELAERGHDVFGVRNVLSGAVGSSVLDD